MKLSVATTSLAATLLLWLGPSFDEVSAFQILHTHHIHHHATTTTIVSKLHGVVKENTEKDQDPSAPPKRFMYMTEEEDRILREKGDREGELMSSNASPLKAAKNKTVGGGGGFANGGGGKSNFKNQAKAYAKALKKDGIVCIENILPDGLADNLKDYLVDLRARGTADIENGIITDSQERFADVLLNTNRCDLKIPLGPQSVHDALHHVLSKSCIQTLIEQVYGNYGGDGKEAELYELNCFMSNSGSRRQLVHADMSCDQTGLHPAEPIMLPVSLRCKILTSPWDPLLGF